MAFVRCLLLLCLLPAVVFGAEPASERIEVGSKFAAADTLKCGDEGNDDAKECLAKLTWTPAKFDVQLQAPERGCGDFLVRFDSPRPVGNPKNDLVAMEWYAARDDMQAIRTAPAMVIVHESGQNMIVARMIARSLFGQGIHAFLVHLPGYGVRREAGAALNANALALQQAISDVRRARDAVAAIPAVDRSRVGLQGTSLGGFVTATVAGLDRGYDQVFIFLAGGDLEEVVLHGAKDAAKMHTRLTAAGVSDDQIKELAHQVEPLRLAHRMNPTATWMFNGKFDDVVPSKCSLALAKAAHLDDDHHVEFLADHYSGVVYLPQLVEQMRARMTEIRDKSDAKETVGAGN